MTTTASSRSCGSSNAQTCRCRACGSSTAAVSRRRIASPRSRSRLLLAQRGTLYRLLPLGGREGTLARYDFTTAAGRVRAKSGHLSGVSSLAGYANTMHHGRVAFAFLIDGSPGDPDAAIVRALDRLVEF